MFYIYDVFPFSSNRNKKIREIKNQKKLLKIFKTSSLYGTTALEAITNPSISEEILQSEKFIKYYKRYNRFDLVVKLINNMKDNEAAQKYYIKMIKLELERLEILTERNNDVVSMVYKSVVLLNDCIEKVNDYSLQKEFFLQATSICAKQKLPIVASVQRGNYHSGKIFGPSFYKQAPIRKLEDEMNEKIKAIAVNTVRIRKTGKFRTPGLA